MRKAKKFISLLVVALMVLTLVPASIGFAAVPLTGVTLTPPAGHALTVGAANNLFTSTVTFATEPAKLYLYTNKVMNINDILSVTSSGGETVYLLNKTAYSDTGVAGYSFDIAKSAALIGDTLTITFLATAQTTASAGASLIFSAKTDVDTVVSATDPTAWVLSAGPLAAIALSNAPIGVPAGDTIGDGVPATDTAITASYKDASGNAASTVGWAFTVVPTAGGAFPVVLTSDVNGAPLTLKLATGTAPGTNSFTITASKAGSTSVVATYTVVTGIGTATGLRIKAATEDAANPNTVDVYVQNIDQFGNLVPAAAAVVFDATKIVLPAGVTWSATPSTTATIAQNTTEVKVGTANCTTAGATALTWTAGYDVTLGKTLMSGNLTWVAGAAASIAYDGSVLAMVDGVLYLPGTSTINIIAKDASGAALSSYVQPTLSASSNTAVATVAGDNGAWDFPASGVAAFTVTKVAAGAATLTFTSGALTCTVPVVFEAAPVGLKVTPSPASVVANGVTTSTITVEAVDANGNRVNSGLNTQGLIPQISTTAGTLGAFNAFVAGKTTVVLTSPTAAASAVVTASVAGLTNGTGTVNFVADTSVSIASSLDVASGKNADGTSYYVYTAKIVDAAGATVANGGRVLNLNIADGTGLLIKNSGGTATLLTGVAGAQVLPLTTGADGTIAVRVMTNGALAAGANFILNVTDSLNKLNGSAVVVPFAKYGAKPVLEVTVDTTKVASQGLFTFNFQALTTNMDRPTAAVTGIASTTSIGTLSKTSVDTDVSGVASITLTLPASTNIAPIVTFGKAGYSVVVYDTARNVLTAASNDVAVYNAGAASAWKVTAAAPAFGKSTVTVQSVDALGNSVAVAVSTLNVYYDGVIASTPAPTTVTGNTDASGKVSFDVISTSGSSYVTVNVQNKTGAALLSTIPATITFAEVDPVDDPVIEITSPDLEATVHAAAITLEGTATADTTLKIKTVTIQDPAGNLSSKAYPAMGVVNFKFNITLPNATLDNPDNAYTIFAEDTAGNVGSTDITISYEPEFAVDENGDPVLDADGNPVYVGQEPEEQPEVPTQPEGPMPTKKVVFTIDSLDFSDGNQPGLLEVAPFLSGYNTMIPFRVLATALGVEVSYDAATQKITFDGDKMIELTVGSDVVIIDGSEDTMPAAVSVKAGRSFVPLRFVANQLLGNPGAIVYEPATKMITITVPVPVVE